MTFNLNDPDAAEKAAQVYWSDTGSDEYAWPRASYQARRSWTKHMRAVLDAIEQPRLPTRSEMNETTKARGYDWRVAEAFAELMVDEGWATEDPEPEVDERQVLTLEELLVDVGGPTWKAIARNLLASGRVTVKVDE